MTIETRKKTRTVVVPKVAWWGDTEAELTFPDDWDVTAYYMEGHDAPPLSDEGFRNAVANPIGVPLVREMARGKM